MANRISRVVVFLACSVIFAPTASAETPPVLRGTVLRSTEVTPSKATDVLWYFVDTSDPCVRKAAYLEVGLGGNSGYNFEVLITDECTGEVLMAGDTVETELEPGDFVLSPNLRTATVNISSPVVNRYEERIGRFGTMTTSQTLTFTRSKAGGGSSYDFRTCLPLEVDPETGEPIPGTQYMRERLHVAGGGTTTTLTQATGSLVVRLADGTQVEFMTPEAEAEGWITTRHGAAVYQVSGPMDKCTERYRE